MTARRIFLFLLLAVLVLFIGGGWWAADWMHRGAIAPSGGLHFFKKLVLPVPQFFQGDPRWGQDELGPAPSTLAAEGCAVSSAAMTLASYGVDVDPGRLNTFLTALPGGYTPQGWIYWEKAAEYDPAMTARLLPHYEDLPSYFLIDWNLMKGNPVIARIRHDGGTTHFVVICGKDGDDYLIRDPGPAGEKGVYPLKEYRTDIEAIRFFNKP
jgi:hypothetical protein